METALTEDRIYYEERVGSRVTDVIISAVFCILFVMALGISKPRLFHWSIIPLFACGVITGTDTVSWFRSRWDIFDPKGIIGVVGFYFFFIAPILFIVWEVTVPYRHAPADLQPWYGLMACLNFVGLICYNLFQRRAFNKKGPYKIAHWEIVPGRAVIVAPLAFLAAFVGQTIFLTVFGGWAGIMAGREYGAWVGIRGMGPFMILGHSLPPLLLITLTVVYAKVGPQRRASLITVFAILLVFTACLLYVTGLAGSRGRIFWNLFWAVGVIHFFWRRVTIKWMMVGLIPFLLFMYLYAFYKIVGRRAFGIFTGEVTLKTLEAESKRNFRTMLLGDLSRADIQAMILYTLVAKPIDYDYRYGKTYIFSSIGYIPYWILRHKPYGWGKIAAGTEIQRGKGVFVPFDPARSSSRVYGMAGETMLNFGLIGIPIAFSIWGYLIGRFRRKLLARYSGDAFFFLIPVFINLAVFTLISDSDNVAFFLIDKIAISLIVVRMMCIKQTFWVSGGERFVEEGEAVALEAQAN